MVGFDKWHEEARAEFKGKDFYKGIWGEGFTVDQQGTVRLEDGTVYPKVVKPYK